MGAKGTPAIGVRFKEGSYTGDGNDDRNISVSVNLTDAQFKFVIIASAGANAAIFRNIDGGGLSNYFTATAEALNLIQGWTVDGFQVGDSNNVNQNTIVYRYIVFWKD